MRTSAMILAVLLTTAVASAQEQGTQPETQPETPAPKYSKDTLLRLFAESAKQEGENPIHFGRGAVEFRALGTSWRFNYLPMMPLSGTMGGVTQEWPDPFALTNTAIATSPRSWRTRRDVSAELKRIEKSERAKIRVTVGSQ